MKRFSGEFGQLMKISFVIPVYRNEGALSSTHEKIKNVFESNLDQHQYEIIFVDDGSDDGSLREIMLAREEDSNVKVITFTRNFGQMAAMIAGFKEAIGAAVINMSADLQDPVELIPEMVKKWEDGDELVICHRSGRSDPLMARLFSKLAYAVLRVGVPQIPSGGFDFVLMDRKVMNSFNATDVRHRFFQGDLLWLGYRTSLIPYVRLERHIGKSQYTFGKKLKNFIDAVLDSSYIPIRFMSLLGMLFFGAGLVYCLSIVWSWTQGEMPFEGWAPIMLAILIIGGLVMLMLGVIGEYVWRINEEVRKRPNYVIRDKYL